MDSNELKSLAQEAGYSKTTLFRAKRALGVKSRKRGLTEGWQWCLQGNGTKNVTTNRNLVQFEDTAEAPVIAGARHQVEFEVAQPLKPEVWDAEEA